MFFYGEHAILLITACVCTCSEGLRYLSYVCVCFSVCLCVYLLPL